MEGFKSMNNPSSEDFHTYERVKNWLEERAAMHFYPPLQNEDDLFPSAATGVRIGPLSSLDNSWTRYEEGYYDVANALVERYSGKFESAWVVYPILFLYRHYLELMLKSLVFEACASFEGESRPKEIADQHNLVVLWDILVDIVSRHRRQRMLGNSVDIRRILAQFTQHDPKSMETRYGLKKDLATPTLQSLENVDIEHVEQIMGKMYNALNEIMVGFQYVDEVWWDD
jgi:hypothetical protein